MKMLVKKLIIPVLTFGVAITMVPPHVSEAAKTIAEMQREEAALQAEISGLDADVVEVVSDIESTKADIEEKSAEIEYTKQRIMEAQQDVDLQAEEMAVRIQYMYENGNTNMLTVMMESDGFTDFLNRAEYVGSVYQYDRQVLDDYENAVAEVTTLKSQLETEMTELESQKSILEKREADLNALISTKSGQLANIQSEISKAREAARKAEELRKQREEQQKAAAAARAANNQSSSSSSASSTSSTAAATSDNTGDANPAPTTGVSGAQIVAYAEQYIGYPYVWAGRTSLTGGVDCSGFVYLVFKNNGITYGGYKTSGQLRSVGQAVSVNNMQAGDIVCYSGHVAIYTGRGTIVEAQDSAHGITNNRSVYCHEILAVRRLI